MNSSPNLGGLLPCISAVHIETACPCALRIILSDKAIPRKRWSLVLLQMTRSWSILTVLGWVVNDLGGFKDYDGCPGARCQHEADA